MADRYIYYESLFIIIDKARAKEKTVLFIIDLYLSFIMNR